MSFADIASELGGKTAPPAGGFGAIANELGLPKKAKPAAQPEPTFQTSDPVKMREALVKHGDPAVLAVFDRQFPDLAGGAGAGRGKTPASAYQQPLSGADAVPGGTVPGTPDAPESWWDKIKGITEAAASTVAGIPAGIAGNVAGIVEGLKPSNYGTPEGAQRASNKAADTAGAITNWVTNGKPTQAGERYAGKIADVANSSGLVAVAPLAEFQTLTQAAGPALRAGKDAARSTMDAARSSFAEKASPPKIEPVFEKPRYVQVNGEWQIKNPELPGGAPDIAETVKPSIQTASPELKSAVKVAEKKGPVPQDILQRHVEADSLPVPIRLSAGQASLDPAVISQEMNNRGKFPELANLYNEQGKKLVQNIDAIKERAAPEVNATNHVEAGQNLIDSYKAYDAPIKADITAKYKAFFDAAGGDIPLNGDGLVASIDTALSKQMKGRYLPDAVRGDLNDIKGGAPLTFEMFENLRTNLAAEARKAQRSGDGNALGAINIARTELEALPMEGEAASLKPLADAARKAAKTRFDKIKADPAYAAAANDSVGVGELSPLADTFIQQHIIKGKAANVAKMSENLSGDPLARQTAAAGAIDYLRSQAKADHETGLFMQSGYNKAWRELSPKQAFLFDPQTSQSLDTLGKVAKYTSVQPKGSYVNNSNTFVAGVADKAATAAEKVGNVAIPGLGLGTDIRGALSRRAAQKAVDSHTAPGAGLTKLRDFPG